MKREDIKKGQRIVEKIDDLRKLRDHIHTMFPKLAEDASFDDTLVVMDMIVRAGCGDIMRETITNVCEKIYEDIVKLEKELEEL